MLWGSWCGESSGGEESVVACSFQVLLQLSVVVTQYMSC